MASTKEIIAPSLVKIPDEARSLPKARVSRLLGGLLVLALGLLPVYLFSSGRPQLVDGPILILLAAHFLRQSEASPALRKNIIPLLPLVAWAALVNVIYFLAEPSDFVPLLKTAELLYTFLIFLAFSYLLREFLEAGNIGLLYAGIFLSILLIFTVKGYSEEGIRSVLSFNNPNQLAYYALILTCFVALLIHFKEKYLPGKVIFLWCDAVILFVAHFLALLSLSRGALLGLFLVDLWIFPRLTRRILALLVPLAVLVGFLVLLKPAVIEERLAGRPGREITPETAREELQQRVFHQFSTMEGIHYLVGRGGRGFTPKEKARGIHEVHNIFGEIFRSYGLIGLGLFSYWLFGMIWRTRLVPGALFIWGGLLIYNMTHYGIRFRSFWILVAFLNAMLWLELKSQEKSGRPLGRRQARSGWELLAR